MNPQAGMISTVFGVSFICWSKNIIMQQQQLFLYIINGTFEGLCFSEDRTQQAENRFYIMSLV